MSGLNANKPRNDDRVAQPDVDPDVYPSYVAQVIDLGVQPQRAFEGVEKKPIQMLMVTYELADVYMVDENGDELEDKPRWVSEEFPLHGLFAENARSTKRYLAIDAQQVFEGNFGGLVGQACNVTTVNKVSKGKTYLNVGNVSPISAKKAAAMPEMKNPTKVFDLSEPDLDVFKALPKWIQEKIQGNLNYNGSKLQELLGGDAPAPKEKEKPAKPGKPAPVDEDDPY